MDPAGLKVLIVCEHASAKFGGEAVLPWHYFRLLRHRGIDVRLLTHERTRGELLALLPEEADRMYFLKDTLLNKLCWKLGRLLPAQISYVTLGYLSRLGTQVAARRLARRLVAVHGIDVVHQPIPVSPREPSLLYGLGAPIVMGPMNGNMSYPPAFVRQGKWRLLESVVSASRRASDLLNRLMPGKLRAAALLVANPRTAAALPLGVRGEVIQLVENGVDLAAWYPQQAQRPPGQPTRFVFAGRLVDWKAVDLLLLAFARVSGSAHLDVIGDGPMKATWSAQAQELGISDRVRFHGWLAQPDAAQLLRQSDVLVLPSLYECGGAVVLEAMATGLPVIATDWGGPADYLDTDCGILVAPSSSEALVAGLTQAMERLDRDPDLRAAMGRAGRRKVETEYDWSAKVEQVLAVHCRMATKANRVSR